MTPTEQGNGLDWKDGILPVSRRFDDPYFSVLNGLEETRHVFLAGNNLPARLFDGFHIAELGFGTGLNLMAVLLAHTGPGRLRYTSFEAYPLLAEDIARALAAFPQAHAVSGPFLAQWAAYSPLGAAGPIQISLPGITVQVIVGDAQKTLPAWQARADAWFLDGFSPAKNPELWGADLMDQVARHTAPGGTFATYTAAGHVRRALAAAGFAVTRRSGYGSKRHMTTGTLAACAVTGADLPDRRTGAAPRTSLQVLARQGTVEASPAAHTAINAMASDPIFETGTGAMATGMAIMQAGPTATPCGMTTTAATAIAVGEATLIGAIVPIPPPPTATVTATEATATGTDVAWATSATAALVTASGATRTATIAPEATVVPAARVPGSVATGTGTTPREATAAAARATVLGATGTGTPVTKATTFGTVIGTGGTALESPETGAERPSFAKATGTAATDCGFMAAESGSSAITLPTATKVTAIAPAAPKAITAFPTIILPPSAAGKLGEGAIDALHSAAQPDGTRT